MTTSGNSTPWIKAILIMFYSCLVTQARMEGYKRGNYFIYEQVIQRRESQKSSKLVYKDLHEVNRMYFNFGECDDAHQDCGMWARGGHCADKSQEIDKLCPWSCHKCAPELLVKQKECKEYSSMCKMWAERGDCFDFPIFMFAFCLKPTTRDSMPRRCQIWARNGDCLTHEKFMLQNCRHSCRTGGNARDHQCHDDVAKCPDWARKGYCNDHYMKRDMKRFCQYSCGWCRFNVMLIRRGRV
ncbi:Nematocyst expressed protein 8 [Acropora cervicornis]|uniref:Nematocyst expressed protein 8 n=1 Tax=Acropora cervicornis TaxID=6130 RepID=A0AAD9QI22_ACRCE|nr:Nematocyst expressed protein 8 [Acropora cervicornis]